MAALALASSDDGRFCRAFGFGHRKPARLAFERAQVFGEGAPDDLQGHRSAANRAADFITGCDILAHTYLCTGWRTRALTWINPPSIAGAKPAPHFSPKAQHPGHSASCPQSAVMRATSCRS